MTIAISNFTSKSQLDSAVRNLIEISIQPYQERAVSEYVVDRIIAEGKVEVYDEELTPLNFD